MQKVLQRLSAAPLTATVSGEQLLKALGGRPNITAVDSCMTRLRLSVVDMNQVDTVELERLGAAGFSRVGADYLQVVMGTQSQAYAEELRRLIDSAEKAHMQTLVSPLTGHAARQNVNSTTVVICMDKGEWSFIEAGSVTAGIDIIARCQTR
ncbi:MAG: PTS system glucose-specific EIICB component [Firmicutes bacterium]|nr:PTS system glucose-specific EIICB component [Bacillota bacterium]